MYIFFYYYISVVIMIYLVYLSVQITGLMTQGRGDGQSWVTSFMVSYSLDALDWEYVSDIYGNQRVSTDINIIIQTCYLGTILVATSISLSDCNVLSVLSTILRVQGFNTKPGRTFCVSTLTKAVMLCYTSHTALVVYYPQTSNVIYRICLLLQVFEGNSDSDTVKHSYLEEPIIARFIRFQTVHWSHHPSMRVEILGCQR